MVDQRSQSTVVSIRLQETKRVSFAGNLVVSVPELDAVQASKDERGTAFQLSREQQATENMSGTNILRGTAINSKQDCLQGALPIVRN